MDIKTRFQDEIIFNMKSKINNELNNGEELVHKCIFTFLSMSQNIIN